MKFRDTRAIYLQIADLICSSIVEGKWSSGDRIASVRDLAAELTVNPATVMRAYDYLSAIEVIEAQRGVGYTVCHGAREKIVATRREEFFRSDLPYLEAKMLELSIEWNEIIGYLNNTKR